MARRNDLAAQAAQAAAELDAKWWKDLTDSEAMRIWPDWPNDCPPDERAVVEARERIARRRRLDLPHADCTSRRRFDLARYVRNARGGFDPPPDCTCLSEALDEAPEDASKDEVLGLSSKRHRAWTRKYPRRRKRRVPRADPEMEPVAAEQPVRVPVAALPPGPPPPAPPNPPQERSTRQRAAREQFTR